MFRSLVVATLLCFTLPLAAQEAEPEVDLPIEEVVAPVEPADHAANIVRDAYAQIDALGEVTVTYAAGVLTLAGTVQQTSDRADAEAIAHKVEGVLFVHNQITVPETAAPNDDPTVRDASIRERLEQIFANVDELSDVTIRVRAGVVRLDGTVLSSAAVANAEALAHAQEGVVYVENSIAEERAVSERISPALAKTREVLQEFVGTLPLLLVGLAIIALFLMLGGFVIRLNFMFRRIEDKPLVLGIVKQFVRLIFAGIGVVLVLELFDLTALVGAVLGTAGVAGLAIGIAFKDIAENYLASLMLSMRRPFEKDDWVLIGDLEGKVVRLTTRETVLMTLDGNHLRVPNARVFGSVITNYTRNPLRRIGFTVGVGVGQDLSNCLKVGSEALAATKGVIEQPSAYGIVESLGDFNVNLHFYAWFDQTTADYFRTKSEAIRRVKLAFDRAGIDMPEPTQRLLQTAWTPPTPDPLPPLDEEGDVEKEGPSTQVDEQIAQDRKLSDEADLLHS